MCGYLDRQNFSGSLGAAENKYLTRLYLHAAAFFYIMGIKKDNDMVRDWVQYELNRIAEKRDKMKVMADKIEEALFDIGVNIDNLVISIHMTVSGNDLYLHIMPFHCTNLYKFEFTFTYVSPITVNKFVS